MSGSKGARASPDLIAACHVFHRLSMPRHPSEALMRLIVLSKTHVWGRIIRPGRTKDLDAPTHALCFLMSSRARPSSFRGSRTDPSIHDVICQCTRPSQGDWKLVFHDRVECLLGGASRGRTDDLMLAKHALYQLSYGPNHEAALAVSLSPTVRPRITQSVVGPGRLELPTSRLSGVCSNQLSYRP